MVNTVFILDNALKVKGMVTINGKNTFFDDKYTMELSTGTESYEFSTNISDIEESDYVMFQYHYQYKLFQIIDIEQEHEEGDIITTVYAESAVLELLNGATRGFTGEFNAKMFFEFLLQDTDWEIGECSDELTTKMVNINVEKTTQIWSCIQDYMEDFGYELNPRVVYGNGIIKKKLIDIYSEGELGERTYKRFEYGRNANGITKKKDLYDWCTALILDTEQDVMNVTYDKGGFIKAKGSDVILATKQNALYNAGKPYVYGNYEDDKSMSGKEVVEKGVKELKRRSVPHIDYEVSAAITYEEYLELNLGDTVYVADHSFAPTLTLEARVGKLELSFTDRNDCKCTLTNYKKVKTKISDMDKPITLTQADILALKKWLADMDIESSEIEKIIENILKNTDDSVIIKPEPTPDPDDDTPPDETEGEVDRENYKTIKISSMDNGLFLGDKRIYDIKEHKASNVKPKDDPADTPKKDDNSKTSKQYKDALEYYSKFRLGSKPNDGDLVTIMSEGNKYKIPVIVRYWCDKFGIDTRLVYAMICAESSGNPYNATGATGGYGLMQCERSAYFNKKQTITFLNGTKRTFTPSYNTMNPKNGITITLNGVKVNQNISNQIMFGCHELRRRAEDCHFNIFATLMGYNFGIGGTYWCVTHYIHDKYGYALAGTSKTRSLSKQSSKVKAKYYEILDTHKAPFASYRKKYKAEFGEGTISNIEGYLQYYKPYKGSLPYFKDKKGRKIGYGVVVPSQPKKEKEPSGSDKRKIIVKIAKEIVSQHVDDRIATYDQDHRTVNFDRPHRWSGLHYGIRNAICYDCSSLVSCAYLKAGLKSVYAKSCKWGSLVSSATSKPGYKMWKCDADGIKKALPGDLIMGCNYKVTASNCTRDKWTGVARTHHVMVYIGDGKVAHARGWHNPPKAICINSLSTLNDYKNGRMFFLRPWDLAAADAKQTRVRAAATTTASADISEVTVKGLPGASPSDYADFLSELTIGDYTDSVKFPTTVKYVFCHFGVGNLDTDEYIGLLKALANKYPKKPIFVAKEWHVNSSYKNAATVNAEIDTFNATMKNYCNQTKYIIFLDTTKGLVDGNGALLSTLSKDGYSMKDEASAKTYYGTVKKAILGIAKGQILDSAATTVKLTAQSQKIHQYSKPVKSFTLKLPVTAEDEFYSRVIFSTDTKSIKFVQPSSLYMSGDNCKKGAFTPKKANKYVINIFKNVDKTLTKKAYYATVTSQYTSITKKQTGQVNTGSSTLNVRKGAGTKYKILGELKNNATVTIISKTSNNWYKIQYKKSYGYVSGKYIDNVKDVPDKVTNYTNYANFKYRDKMVANAETFYKNRTKFVYNNKTAFDFSNPKENVSSWKTGDKFHMDDHFFTLLVCMGYEYKTCELEKKTSRPKATGVSWAIPYISSESKMARYFVEQGWVLDDVDYDNFSNVEPGDILFYDVDTTMNDEYMACSHTAICIGKDADKDCLLIEGNNDSNVIRKVKAKERGTANLLFVGRINLNK